MIPNPQAEIQSFRNQRYTKEIKPDPETWIYAQVVGQPKALFINFAPSRLAEMKEKYGELIYLKNKPKTT